MTHDLLNTTSNPMIVGFCLLIASISLHIARREFKRRRIEKLERHFCDLLRREVLSKERTPSTQVRNTSWPVCELTAGGRG